MKNFPLKIGKLKLKNPVMVASGTFGYGVEYARVIDLDKLGAIVTKTITLKPRPGNLQPRIHELPYGLINSVGLQNVGVSDFLADKLPKLRKITKTPVIASISGATVYEYEKLAERLDGEVDAIELNLSCPNIKAAGGCRNRPSGLSPSVAKGFQPSLFSQDAKKMRHILINVKKHTKLPVIVKLSPAVTDIREIAMAAESAGADALSLINSFPVIFYESPIAGRRSPVFGGLSGPCVKHIALKMVYETSSVVKIPVVGIGGITTIQDAREFFLAGAKFIAIGSANFINPQAAIEIIDGIGKYKPQVNTG